MAGNEIIALGILLMAGFAGGKASYAARLPSVTGYIVAGLLLGPSLLDLITPETVEKLEFINSLALSLIAISVGGKLDLKELAGGFGTILSVSLFQTVLVGAGTFTTLAVLGIDPALALQLSLTPDQQHRIATRLVTLETTLTRISPSQQTQIQKARSLARRECFAVLNVLQRESLRLLAGLPMDFSKVVQRAFKAPEFTGVNAWINSHGLTRAEL